ALAVVPPARPHRRRRLWRASPHARSRWTCLSGGLTPLPFTKPGERSRRVRVRWLLRLAPGWDLADEWHPRVQLAHLVDEAKPLGRLGRTRLRGQPLTRPPEEFGEPALRLEVAPDHHRVVGLERLRHAIHQRPREPERVADLAD